MPHLQRVTNHFHEEHGYHYFYTEALCHSTNTCIFFPKHCKKKKKKWVCTYVKRYIYFALSLYPLFLSISPSRQRWRRLPYIIACDFLDCRPFPLCSVYTYKRERAHSHCFAAPGMMPALVSWWIPFTEQGWSWHGKKGGSGGKWEGTKTIIATDKRNF